MKLTVRTHISPARMTAIVLGAILFLAACGGPGGTALSTHSAGPPTISSISPTSGLTGGGTVVTIIGTNFQDGATVSFGQSAALVTRFDSSTKLEATTPLESTGLVDVTVANPDGQSAVARGAFTFVLHVVSLAWNPSTSTVAGYNIYRATASGGPFSKINPSLIAGTTYTDDTVQGDTTYFYVATAVDSSGTESVFSNEVLALVPKP
jgi:IPT/TIG domain